MSNMTIFVIGAIVAVICVFFVAFSTREAFKAGKEATHKLRRSGRSKAPEPPASARREMHGDHVVATSEHAGWLEEIDAWHAGHSEVLPLLSRLESALRDRDAELAGHAEAIRKHQAEIDRHELAMGTPEGSGEDTGRGSRWAVEHELLQSRHAVIRGTHQQLREIHRRVKEGLSQLVELAEAHPPRS